MTTAQPKTTFGKNPLGILQRGAPSCGYTNWLMVSGHVVPKWQEYSRVESIIGMRLSLCCIDCEAIVLEE